MFPGSGANTSSDSLGAPAREETKTGLSKAWQMMKFFYQNDATRYSNNRINLTQKELYEGKVIASTYTHTYIFHPFS